MFNPKSATPDGNNYVAMVQLIGTDLVFTSDSVASPAFMGSIDLSSLGVDTNDIDFINDVQLVGNQLQFTGTGNAFTGNLTLPGSTTVDNMNGTVNITTSDGNSTNNVVTGQQSSCNEVTAGNTTTYTLTMNNGDVCAIAITSTATGDDFLSMVTCNAATLEWTYTLDGGGTIVADFSACFPTVTAQPDNSCNLVIPGPNGDTLNLGAPHPLQNLTGQAPGTKSMQLREGTYFRTDPTAQANEYVVTNLYNLTTPVDTDKLLITGIEQISSGNTTNVDSSNGQAANIDSFLQELNTLTGLTLTGPVTVPYNDGATSNPSPVSLSIANVAPGDQATLNDYRPIYGSLSASYQSSSWAAVASAQPFIVKITVDAAGIATGIPAGETPTTMNIPSVTTQNPVDVYFFHQWDPKTNTLTQEWRNVADDATATAANICPGKQHKPNVRGQIECDNGLILKDFSYSSHVGGTLTTNTLTIYDNTGQMVMVDFVANGSEQTVQTMNMVNDAGAWLYHHVVEDNLGNCNESFGCIIPSDDCVTTFNFFLDGDPTQANVSPEMGVAFNDLDPIQITDGTGTNTPVSPVINNKAELVAYLATIGATTNADCSVITGGPGNLPVCFVQFQCGMRVYVDELANPSNGANADEYVFTTQWGNTVARIISSDDLQLQANQMRIINSGGQAGPGTYSFEVLSDSGLINPPAINGKVAARCPAPQFYTVWNCTDMDQLDTTQEITGLGTNATYSSNQTGGGIDANDFSWTPSGTPGNGGILEPLAAAGVNVNQSSNQITEIGDATGWAFNGGRALGDTIFFRMFHRAALPCLLRTLCGNAIDLIDWDGTALPATTAFCPVPTLAGGTLQATPGGFSITIPNPPVAGEVEVRIWTNYGSGGEFNPVRQADGTSVWGNAFPVLADTNNLVTGAAGSLSADNLTYSIDIDTTALQASATPELWISAEVLCIIGGNTVSRNAIPTIKLL